MIEPGEQCDTGPSRGVCPAPCGVSCTDNNCGLCGTESCTAWSPDPCTPGSTQTRTCSDSCGSNGETRQCPNDITCTGSGGFCAAAQPSNSASASGTCGTGACYRCNSGYILNTQTGQCVSSSCTDDCNPGMKQCISGVITTCGNYDADPCYEFGDSVTCYNSNYCVGDTCGSNAVCDNTWRHVLAYGSTAAQPVGIYVPSTNPSAVLQDSIGLAIRGTNAGIYWTRCQFSGTTCNWYPSWVPFGVIGTLEAPFTFLSGSDWKIQARDSSGNTREWTNTVGGGSLGVVPQPWGTPASTSDPYGNTWRFRQGSNTMVQYCCGTSTANCDANTNTVCSVNPQCGNGFVEPGEQCDLGGNNGPYPRSCSITCTLNSGSNCGNGIVEGTEQCDNGASNGVSCPAVCDSTTCTVRDCATCVTPSPNTIQPSGTYSGNTLTLTWTHAPGTWWYAIRIDDPTGDHWVDPQFGTCGGGSIYYCVDLVWSGENTALTTPATSAPVCDMATKRCQISGIPFVRGRTYSVWMNAVRKGIPCVAPAFPFGGSCYCPTVGGAGFTAYDRPQMTLAPASFTFTVPQGSSGNQPLAISNVGQGPLSWSASDNAAWLSLAATSGTLTQSSSTNFPVTADASSLTPGSYGGTISLDSNYCPMSIPVTLNVNPPPCDTNAAGVNKMIGCAWTGTNFNTLHSTLPDDLPSASGFADVFTAVPQRGYGAGGPNGLVDSYTLRWKGTFSFSGGTYRITTRNLDDGARFYMNSGTSAPFFDATWPAVPLGQAHYADAVIGSGSSQVWLEFMENTGTADVSLHWSKIARDSQCLGMTAPAQVAPGASFPVTVTMGNNGPNEAVTWNDNILDTENYMVLWSVQGSPWITSGGGNQWRNLPAAQVTKGDQTTFAFSETAPNVAGTYTLGYYMAQSNIGFFGATCSQLITVGNSPTLTSVSAAPACVRNGGAFSVTSVASDPDGQTMTLSCTEGGPILPGTCPASASNPSCAYTSTWATNAVHTLTCTATDSGGAASSTRTTAITSDVTLPVVSGAVSVAPVGPGSADAITFSGSASDANCGMTQYRILVEGVPRCTGVSTCTANLAPNTLVPANGLSFYDYTVVQEATDAAGNINTRTDIVRVKRTVSITSATIAPDPSVASSTATGRCGTTGGQPSCIDAVLGSTPCTWTSWNVNEAVFSCPVGAVCPATQTFTCSVNTAPDKCKAGATPSMSTSLGVTCGACGAYVNPGTCSAAPENCEWIYPEGSSSTPNACFYVGKGAPPKYFNSGAGVCVPRNSPVYSCQQGKCTATCDTNGGCPSQYGCGPSVSASPTTIISDFESGFGTDAYDWNEGALHSRANDRAHRGTQSLKASSGVALASATVNFIPVSPNTQYNVSGFVFLDAAFNGNAVIDLNDGNGQGGAFTECQVSASLAIRNAWQEVQCYFTTGPATTGITLRAITDVGVAGGFAWFDDLMVRPMAARVYYGRGGVCDTASSCGCSYGGWVADSDAVSKVMCGALCDRSSAPTDCPGGLQGDTCYYRGGFSSTCGDDLACRYDQEFCPVAGTVQGPVPGGICYYGSRTCDYDSGCALQTCVMAINHDCDAVQGCLVNPNIVMEASISFDKVFVRTNDIVHARVSGRVVNTQSGAELRKCTAPSCSVSELTIDKNTKPMNNLRDYLGAANINSYYESGFERWNLPIDTSRPEFQSELTACLDGYGISDCGSSSYFSQPGTVAITVKYPDMVAQTVPAVSGVTPDAPNVTRGSLLKLVASAVGDNGAGLTQACSGSQCDVVYDITISGGSPVYTRQLFWDGFDKGYKVLPAGGAATDTLQCDQWYSLWVKTTIQSGPLAPSSGEQSFDFWVSCQPRVVVTPIEARVSVGQQNLQPFTVTFLNPRDAMNNLELTMSSSSAINPVGWLQLQGSGVAVDGKSATFAVPALSSAEYLVLMPLAPRSGSYPVTFTVTDLNSNNQWQKTGTLQIFSESLPEFAPWQLVVLIALAPLLYLRFGDVRRR